MTGLSLVSSLLWYGILVFAGYTLGEHWDRVGTYLASYSEVMTGLVLVALAVWLLRAYWKKRRARTPDA